jgi:hypothetical protein
LAAQCLKKEEEFMSDNVRPRRVILDLAVTLDGFMVEPFLLQPLSI